MKFLTINIILLFSILLSGQNNIIVDSELTLDEAIIGIKIPAAIKNDLRLVDVEYFSFDNKLHKGQIVVHKNLVKDIQHIFSFVKETRFPVSKVIPVVKYNWSDDESMLDNNSSGFQYRKIRNTNIVSKHSYGRAIDINPFLNPMIKRGKVFPKGAAYDVNSPGTLSNHSPLVKEFKKLGWKWGGNWRSSKDYQHFEK